MQAALALVMTTLHGYASPKTGAVYERAFALTRNVANPPELFQIMYGLSMNRGLGERFLEGLSIAEQMANYADTSNDNSGHAVAHRFYGSLLFFLPDFERAKEHLESAIASYEQLNSERLVDEYGHDPKVLSLLFLAQVQNYRGYPDRTVPLVHEAITHAESLNFPYGTAHAHWIASQTFLDINDFGESGQHSKKILTISEEKRFPFFSCIGAILSGWAGHCVQDPEAFKQLEHNFRRLETISPGMVTLQHIATLIDALIREQQFDQAKRRILDAVNESLSLIHI